MIVDELNALKPFIESMHWREDEVERFFICLEKFSENQRKMLIELSKAFLIYRFNDYLSTLKTLFSNKLPNNLLQTRILYVLPMLPEEELEDFGKSAYKIVNFFHSAELQSHSFFRNKQIVYPKSIRILDWLPEPGSISDDASFLLVDDFLGTGTTAKEAIRFYLHKGNIPLQRIAVLVFVVQELGLSALKREFNIPVIYHQIRKRGISDNYLSPIKETYLSEMNLIEQKLKVREDFNLGWGKSEALVSMDRTPNNTFPFYWLKNKQYIGPFPRL